jgi:tol-pal system protein YbgF
MMLLCAGLFVSACGGGRNKAESTTTPEGEVDIDKLLNTPEQEKQQNAEDAEVLRLLGITPAEAAKPEATPAQTTTEPQSTPVTSEMQKEIDRLQQELNDKNRQVSDLRNTLAEREQRIQDLQKQYDRTQAQNNRTRGSNNYVQRYAGARDLYEQRRYNEAITAFQGLLAENDRSSYADNCQYWIGECYYGLGKYAQAIAEFEKVFTFPRSNKNDAALLKLGLCNLRLGDRQQARSGFEQLIANYPSSPYVQNARKYLSRL